MAEMFSEIDLQEAERRWDEEVGCFPAALQARFDRVWRRVIVSLDSGLEIAVDPAEFKGLCHAPEDALGKIELWACGYDLYFPLLDEDIYLPHLFREKFPGLVSRSALRDQTEVDVAA